MCCCFLVKGNLRSWLQDENCYDQCALLYNQGEQVAIAQCAPQELKLVMERMVSLPPSLPPSCPLYSTSVPPAFHGGRPPLVAPRLLPRHRAQDGCCTVGH